MWFTSINPTEPGDGRGPGAADGEEVLHALSGLRGGGCQVGVGRVQRETVEIKAQKAHLRLALRNSTET